MSNRLPQVRDPIDFRLSLADLGNAQRLTHHFGERIRYVGPLGTWFYFDGRLWAVDETGEVMRCAKATAQAIANEVDAWPSEDERKALFGWASRSKSRGRLEAMIALAATQPGVALLPQQLDADPCLLNVENGTVNLRTGKLRPHDPADLLTKMGNAEYEEGARSETWNRFLQEITGGSEDLQRLLKRAVGCTLSGDENEKVLFVLWGEGDTGKTTFLRVIMDVLGDYAIQAERNLLLQRSHEAHPTGIADLFGRRMAVCTEVNKEQRFDSGLVKQLTGKDRLKARRMRQDFFEFDPTHTLWLACNDVPHLDASDGALWNRLCIIPFEHRIPVEKQDKNLVDRLWEDRAAILAWAVEGCLEWQKEGLSPPSELDAAKVEHRKNVDPIYRFIDECCERAPGEFAGATPLYERYREWAASMGLAPRSQKAFGTHLDNLGVAKDRDSMGRVIYLELRVLKDLKGAPLSMQDNDMGGITDDPSDGSEFGCEVLSVAS